MWVKYYSYFCATSSSSFYDVWRGLARKIIQNFDTFGQYEHNQGMQISPTCNFYLHINLWYWHDLWQEQVHVCINAHMSVYVCIVFVGTPVYSDVHANLYNFICICFLIQVITLVHIPSDRIIWLASICKDDPVFTFPVLFPDV